MEVNEEHSPISIPLGTIIRYLCRLIYQIVTKISIPLGTIISSPKSNDTFVLLLFQFHLVQL